MFQTTNQLWFMIQLTTIVYGFITHLITGGTHIVRSVNVIHLGNGERIIMKMFHDRVIVGNPALIIQKGEYWNS